VSHAASAANFSSWLHGGPRFAECSDATLERGELHAECLQRSRRKKLFLPDAFDWQVADAARRAQAVAKQLAIRGMNQRV
jgi:hypothetical protein